MSAAAVVLIVVGMALLAIAAIAGGPSELDRALQGDEVAS